MYVVELCFLNCSKKVLYFIDVKLMQMLFLSRDAYAVV